MKSFLIISSIFLLCFILTFILCALKIASIADNEEKLYNIHGE